MQSHIQTYNRWDCSFNHGSLVEEVDGHTTILYHRLQLDWFPTCDAVVLFQSREHASCPPEPGWVTVHVESGGFNISPLKPSRNGEPRSQVQHLMQIDWKGWGVKYLTNFQQHCLFHMLNSVACNLRFFL